MEERVKVQRSAAEPQYMSAAQSMQRKPFAPAVQVSAPSDPLEKEADQVAAQVVSAPESMGPPAAQNAGGAPALQCKPAEKVSRVQRKPLEVQAKCAACETTEEPEVQRMEMPEVQAKCEDCGGDENPEQEQENTAEDLNARKGKGQSLPEPVKQEMEAGFGADFSEVQIHHDPEAHQLNKSLNARAFTSGKDIFFRSGEFDPNSRKGKELLAHELTHTIQQGAVQPEIPAAETPVTENSVPETPAQETLPADPALHSPATTAPEPQVTAKDARLNPGQKPAAPKPGDLQGMEGLASEALTGEQEAPAEVPEAELNATDGPAVVESLSQMRPLQRIQALDQTGDALYAAQTAEQAAAKAELPEIMSPTGLSPTVEKKPEKEKPKRETHVMPKLKGRGKFEKKLEKTTKAEIPAQWKKQESFRMKDIGSPENYAEKLKSLPATDPTVSTKMGKRPPVDLSGEADPQQQDQMREQNNQQMSKAYLQSAKATKQNFGEHNMFPRVKPEVLKADTEFKPPKRFTSKKRKGELPELPAAGAQNWEQHLMKMNGPRLHQSVLDAHTAQDNAALESEKARADGMQKIEAETAKTTAEQQTLQDQGRAEVAAHRESWQQENAQVMEEYNAKSDAEHNRVNTDIGKQVDEADAKIETEYANAEKAAEEEKRKAEEEAERKRKEEEERSKNRSWWQKIGDAIKDAFNALKQLVVKIFDKLREAVKFLIDKAKQAVSFIIDKVRDAVVALVKLLGEALKAFVSIALAAFPEIRDKFIGYIDQAVNATVNAIDVLAGALKDLANMYLDFVGQTMELVLDVAQGIVMVSIMINELIITGESELITGIANLYDAASSMTMDMFWDGVMTEMTGMDPAQPLEELEWKDEAEKEAGLQARIQELSGQQGITPEADGTAPAAQEEPVTGIEMDSMPEEEWDPALLEEVSNMRDGESRTVDGASDPVTMKELAQGEVVQEGGGTEMQENTGMEQQAGGTGVQGIETEGGVNPFTESDDDKLKRFLEGMKPDCEEKQESTGESGGKMPAEAKVGPLPIAKRREYLIEQLKRGISNWWDCNWGYVVAALLGVLVVGVILTVVTAGGFLAILPVIMEVLAAIFLATMMVKMSGFVKEFLEIGWEGKDPVTAARKLAYGLAVGAVELIFEGIMKVGGALIKAIKAMVKGIINGIKYAIKGAVWLTKQAVKLGSKILRSLKVAGQYTIRKGKYVFTGLKKGFSKGVRKVRDLADRVGNFIKFRKFKVVRKGMWFEFWGEVNPWVLLASGKVKKVKNDEMVSRSGQPGKFKVGDKVKVGRDEGIVIGSHGAFSGSTPKNFISSLDETATEVNQKLFKQLDNMSDAARLRKITGSGVPRNSMFRTNYFKSLEKMGVKLSENARKLIAVHHVLPNFLKGGKLAEFITKQMGYNIDDLMNAIGLPRLDFSALDELLGELDQLTRISDELAQQGEKMGLKEADDLAKAQARYAQILEDLELPPGTSGDDLRSLMDELSSFRNSSVHDGYHNLYNEMIQKNILSMKRMLEQGRPLEDVKFIFTGFVNDLKQGLISGTIKL